MQTVKTDQTGWMHRLLFVFAGHTGHFIGFVMRWLSYTIIILSIGTDRATLKIIFVSLYPTLSKREGSFGKNLFFFLKEG